MEKAWDDFWASGKVTDYLAYRGITAGGEGAQKEHKSDGTADERDGYGSFHDACR